MNCPYCGSATIPGNRFCHRCRKKLDLGTATTVPPVAPPSRRPTPLPRPPVPAADAVPAPSRPPVEDVPAAAPAAFDPRPVGSATHKHTRPRAITLLSILSLVCAVGCAILASIFTLVPGLDLPRDQAVWFRALGGFMWLGTAACLVSGIGMWRLAGWGRWTQVGLSVLGLLGVPLGTLFSIATLHYLFKPGLVLLFCGRPPSAMTPDERAAIVRDSPASCLLVGALWLMAVIPAVGMLGVVAAITIPSLLRARISANESAAIADVGAVVAAQAAYAESNGGLHDDLDCLVTPSQCIPGYPPTAPTFLPPELTASSTRKGYTFTFQRGGPPESWRHDAERSSATGMLTFAYVALPAEPGRTGQRAVCGDASGRVCVMSSSKLELEGGLCPTSCEDR